MISIFVTLSAAFLYFDDNVFSDILFNYFLGNRKKAVLRCRFFTVSGVEKLRSQV